MPLFKSMLALLGRIPCADVAVLATMLAHFAHLVELWIVELERMDVNDSGAHILHPAEPYLARMEAEALIALCHAHVSARTATRAHSP